MAGGMEGAAVGCMGIFLPGGSGFRRMWALRVGRYHPERADHRGNQEHGMTVDDRQSGIEALGPPPLWVCALLGIVMIAAGIFALSDVAFATIISVKLIGLTAIAAGAFEIMHAFWTKGQAPPARWRESC